jgi:oxygen-independent coproporphyrinogen-3 oxidase
VRHRKPENWLKAVEDSGHGVAEQRVLGQQEQASEALLMGLRLNDGVDVGELSRRSGLSDLIDERRFEFHRRNGLLWREGDRIGLTEAGFPLLDALLAELVSGELVG